MPETVSSVGTPSAFSFEGLDRKRADSAAPSKHVSV